MRTDPVTQSSGNSPHRGHRPSGAWFARGIVVTLFLLSGAALAPRAMSGEITYAIQNYPADQDGHTLSGDIVTDGTFGAITSSDIISWTVTIDSVQTFSSTEPQSNTILIGEVIATSTSITMAPATSTHRFNDLDLDINLNQNTVEYQLGYHRNLNFNNTQYSNYDAFTPSGTQWSILGISQLGGTDPWLIAAVPEPSTAVLAVSGAVMLLATGWVRRRREQRRQVAGGQPQPNK